MTDRAGPPTPRNKSCEDAWTEYFMTRDAHWSTIDRAFAKSAFIAGWQARKAAQYAALVNDVRKTTLDIVSKPATPQTLFPTEREIDDAS